MFERGQWVQVMWRGMILTGRVAKVRGKYVGVAQGPRLAAFMWYPANTVTAV